MNLIRVVSSDGQTSGTLINVFNGDFTLKPQSTIGLAQAGLDLSFDSIIVKSTNNTLQYKLAAPQNYKTVTLTSGTYNSKTLIDELNKQINGELDISEKYNAGFQWKASYSDTLDLSFDRSDKKFPNFDLKTSNITVTTATKSVVRNEPTSVLWDQFVGTNALFINGCGSYQGTISDTSGGPSSEISLLSGLVSIKVDPTQAEQKESDYNYGIRLQNGKYGYIENGGK